MGTNPQGYFIITPMKLNIGWARAERPYLLYADCKNDLSFGHGTHILLLQRYGICESWLGA
jgi:hypothetical protein